MKEGLDLFWVAQKTDERFVSGARETDLTRHGALSL